MRWLALAAALVGLFLTPLSGWSPALADDAKFDLLGIGADSTKSAAIDSLKKREADGAIESWGRGDGLPSKQCQLSKESSCLVKRFSVGNITINSLWLSFGHGGLDTMFVQIPRRQYGKMLSILLLKYGQPINSDVAEYANRMGAKFSGRVNKWSFSDGYVSFDEIPAEKAGSDSMDESLIYFSSKSSRDEFLKKEEEMAGKARKSF